MIYEIREIDKPKVGELGAKAKKLIEMNMAGFTIPEGIILSVDFFKPWLNEIKSSSEWISLLENPSKENSNIVKAKAEKILFTQEQKELLMLSLENLPGERFAVRSSSPEEDLTNISFAGMYESYLGIKKENLEEFIIKCFSSCFDFRLITYKLQNKIGLESTEIAIIIQRQIKSSSSGVAFSLNPINNAFDEVFINASYGLGEAIVSGLVNPDSYVVDSSKNEIIYKKINNKKFALNLKASGGTEKIKIANPTSQCLKDEEIIKLSKLIKKLESYYNHPVDMEWTFEDNKLYLLQVRSITTHFPFFKELLTKPGENKRFYIDIMLLTQGFSQPLSVLGLDLWIYMIDQLKMNTMTPQINGSAPAIYGKEYLSITAFKKIFGKRQTSTFIGSFDTNLKKIFKDINLDEHAFIGEVEGTKNYKKVVLKSIIKVLPSALKGLFGDYKKEIDKYKETSREIIEATKKLKDNGDFSSISKSGLTLMSKSINSIPIIMSGFLAKNSISKIFVGDKLEKEISALNMNLEGNPTSQMNYILFLMASHKDFQEVSSKDEFIERLKKRDFSKAFLNLFDQFMEKYSCRVFKEIDVASKRIYEDLGLLYNKLIKINTEDNHILKVQEKRQIAYNKLFKYAKSKGKEKKFIKSANKLKATFGYREHPKYLLIFIISKLHDICLEIANQWVEEGRLEEAYHIFDLKADQISQGQKDPYFNLNKARLENLSGYLDTNLWPLVIDSRGKIYIPKLEIKNGDFIGQAIAPGKVIGPAKILKTPYEKFLNPGEILVVKATEPSWTPIFTNASGIIMEIGGPLQHGGIIAREYGIPCVSGLMGFMDKIKDGDILEVDGSSGLVKILDSK